MNTIIKNITLLLLTVVAVAACKKEEDLEPIVEYDKATLSIRNFMTYDGSFDFLINDLKITDGVAYAFGATSEFEWIKGEPSVTHSINISGGNEVFTTTLDVAADGAYLSALVGPITSGTVILSNNDQTTPVSSNIRLRFLHAYQGEGGIDIYIGGSEASHKVVSNLEYAKLSSYIEPAAADINASFIVTKTGIAPNPDTNLITTIDFDGHTAGNIYLDVFASETIDPLSDLRWYITPQ